MDMVGSSALSSVDSLLGRLSSVFAEEAQLLRSVHDDMQFIKREMESMNGFLQDVGDEADGRGNGSNHQVRAWRRQVHELADESQSCVDRYVQTLGAATHPAPGAAGLLASLGRVPTLVRTLPSRHRIAKEIRGLKARAIEVGERRQRYGVLVQQQHDGGSSSPVAAIANREAEDARRRRALDQVHELLDDTARVTELVAWLRGKPPPVPRGRLRRNSLVTAGQLIHKICAGRGGPKVREDLEMEVIKLIRSVDASGNPENVVEAAGYLREAMLEVGTQEVKVIVSWLLDKILGRADEPPQELEENKGGSSAGTTMELLVDMFNAAKDVMVNLIGVAKDFSHSWSVSEAGKAMWGLMEDMFKALKEAMDKFVGSADQSQHGPQAPRRPAATQNQNLFEMVKAAKEPMEVARAEARYVAAQILWLLKMFLSRMFLLNRKHVHHPKVITIVTPPVEDQSNDDDAPDQQLGETTHATELAKKVFDHSSTSNHFDTKVWVDAKDKSDLKQRLMSILRQVLLPSCPANSNDDNNNNEWEDLSEEELKTRISECLKGKKLLMVIADPEDDNAWQDITSALSTGHGESAVIETPRIKYMAQFHAWYMASRIFFAMRVSSRYQVHFCSNLVGMRKVASELVGGDQLPGSISAILKKCLWDSFATKMFLHALYANPHRSDAELERLMLGLRYSSSVRNARRMIHFCFEDLPRQYQSCLLSLSVLPPQGTTLSFKRARLVRRWAAGNFSARGGLAAVDEADRCFDALVARGLLQPADIVPAGKVKSCTVHPHVHSFITKMGSSYHTRSGVPLSLLENQPAASHSSCCGKFRSRDTPSRHVSLREVETLLNLLPASSDQLGLVKLLDLEGCTGLKKGHLKKICNKIFQLKYLSLRNTYATELPKEINKLRYLETLDIRQTEIKQFPGNTIALPKLMHLLAGHTDHESTEAIGPDNRFSTVHLPSQIGSMTNMQVLSHVEVSDSDKSQGENVDQKLHLKKLGVVIRSKDPAHVLFGVIGMLHVESLCSLSVHLEPENAEDYSINELPHQLSKITLCRTKLREEDIKKLGELANLRCIRLRQQSYTHHKLTFNTSEFRKLELLVIEDPGISEIHFDKNAAPMLKKIVWNFASAEITLSGIQELPDLKEIHVGGNCDESHLSKIKQEIKENTKLYTNGVIYTPIHTKPNAAAATDAATGAATAASSSNASVFK